MSGGGGDEALVRMANQIATFFRSQPGGDAAERVAAHLTDFWAPDMRRRFVAHAVAGDPALDPLAAAAARLLARAGGEVVVPESQRFVED